MPCRPFCSSIFGIYFTWFWARGQTLAMKTWDIALVDTRGQPVTQARALLRYLLSWFWLLPPLAAIAPFGLSGGESFVIVTGWVLVWALLSRFHPQQQFWHDAIRRHAPGHAGPEASPLSAARTQPDHAADRNVWLRPSLPDLHDNADMPVSQTPPDRP